MATLTPEWAIFYRDYMLDALRREQPVTQRVVEAVPVDKGDYRPDAVGKSALELAWHIVGAEHRFMDAVVTGTFDFSNSGRPADLTNSAEVARWYAGTFQDDISRLAALSAEQLMKIVDFRGIFQLPAVVYLHTASIHSIHHRGQLSMYLRPMGAKVPAIYGESYDSAQARLAATKA
jgi:uncharacterized damage-inducible protein DinB